MKTKKRNVEKRRFIPNESNWKNWNVQKDQKRYYVNIGFELTNATDFSSLDWNFTSNIWMKDGIPTWFRCLVQSEHELKVAGKLSHNFAKFVEIQWCCWSFTCFSFTALWMWHWMLLGLVDDVKGSQRVLGMEHQRASSPKKDSSSCIAFSGLSPNSHQVIFCYFRSWLFQLEVIFFWRAEKFSAEAWAQPCFWLRENKPCKYYFMNRLSLSFKSQFFNSEETWWTIILYCLEFFIGVLKSLISKRRKIQSSNIKFMCPRLRQLSQHTCEA